MRHLPVFAYRLFAVVLMAPLFVHAQGLENPLRFGTIPELVAALLQALVTISLPIIALFIVWGGFQYITAQGNTTKIENAHKTFLWTIIGAILILGAWTLANILGDTIDTLR
jgi:hypothetical protein